MPTALPSEVVRELEAIGRDILAHGLTSEEWAARESCDMFQSPHLCGGFEAEERAFCFSAYLPDGEVWFQLTLPEVQVLVSGQELSLALRPSG